MASTRVSPVALRTFEAVGRHLSFTRAAEELSVTQSAVSQHVSQLEARLGRTLVARRGRAVGLTPDGETLHAACRRGFALIDSALERIGADGGAHRLRIKVPPTFAMKWLMPRLPRFQVLHPQLELGLSTSVQPADFEAENVDVSVVRAAERVRGLHAVPVLVERMLLVCSPRLWGRRRARLASLDGMTMLHTVNRRDDWDAWLRQAGGQHVRRGAQLEFDVSLLVHQAAVEGLGVAVVQPELVEDELASGRLIAPFDVIYPTGRTFYIVCPESRRDVPAVARFLDWVARAADDPAARAPRRARAEPPRTARPASA